MEFKEFSEDMEEIFWEAIKTGDLETVLMFLEAGIDPNVQYAFGLVPLHLAIVHNRLEIVRLLLAVGADLDITDEMGKTPLYYAIVYERVEIARLLRKYGAI